MGICGSSVRSVDDSVRGLFDGRRTYFGREDYWHSNPCSDNGNVRDKHIFIIQNVAESQEILEGNLNKVSSTSFMVFSFCKTIGLNP